MNLPSYDRPTKISFLRIRLDRTKAPTMTTNREKTFSVGKYLVSPLTQLTPTGSYAPSVSIRSGQGRGTHDRVFRFLARFPTREAARRYATEQGLLWLQRSEDPPHLTH
jgi:hypothetical protein